MIVRYLAHACKAARITSLSIARLLLRISLPAALQWKSDFPTKLRVRDYEYDYRISNAFVPPCC